jgi:hypothetical protein
VQLLLLVRLWLHSLRQVLLCRLQMLLPAQGGCLQGGSFKRLLSGLVATIKYLSSLADV